MDELRNLYRQYVATGEDEVLQKLTEQLKRLVTKVRTPESHEENETGSRKFTEEPSESMQELMEELEPIMDEVGLPGTPEDPAIPPEDRDEYITPPAREGETKEKLDSQSIFTIEPAGDSDKPLIGNYISGRKSYYDKDRKVWSKRKKIQPYSGKVSTGKRQAISGMTNQGLKALPIPNNYDLDINSLVATGAEIDVLRDQNGCFYISSKGNSSFRIEFGKADNAFVSQPVREDTEEIYEGTLSVNTEKAIQSLNGSNLEKALQARKHVVGNHWYPGGGDLQTAQALQYKLRNESTKENYIQNLDASEYLECYSAATLMIAMARKAGVPARLVTGHKIEGAKDGKASIDSTTGHAWVEIWDEDKWVRVDPTPKAKPQDKKAEEEDKHDQTEVEQAEDDGMDVSDDSEAGGEPGQQTGPSGQFGMGEANNEQIDDAESQLEQAEERVESVDNTNRDLKQRISEIEKASELKEAQEEVEDADVFDDVKEELEERVKAKEEAMKEEIEENLNKMMEDGFIDEDEAEAIKDKIGDADLDEIESLQQEIEEHSELYNEYEEIKEEVEPVVDEWLKYFVERLPRDHDIEIDQDSLSRQGAFNRRSAMRARNLMFGTVKNPRIIQPSVKPRFLASQVVDVSGSMQGEKLKQARKLMVFFNELFSAISNEYGYIGYANYAFANNIKEVKGFDQDYDSSKKYAYKDNGATTSSTVKVRLMKSVQAKGGTNMLEAVKTAAADLNREVEDNPDFASALYFIGDGGDTCGNEGRIREFLAIRDSETGFGEHMLSAIMLGDQAQREELERIFGEENTTVAPTFDQLVEQFMYKFEDDIEDYLSDKTVSATSI